VIEAEQTEPQLTCTFEKDLVTALKDKKKDCKYDSLYKTKVSVNLPFMTFKCETCFLQFSFSVSALASASLPATSSKEAVLRKLGLFLFNKIKIGLFHSEIPCGA
jgi:hypothetical protein